jgi:hypothetical protein
MYITKVKLHHIFTSSNSKMQKSINSSFTFFIQVHGTSVESSIFLTMSHFMPALIRQCPCPLMIRDLSPNTTMCIRSGRTDNRILWALPCLDCAFSCIGLASPSGPTQMYNYTKTLLQKIDFDANKLHLIPNLIEGFSRVFRSCPPKIIT